MLLDHLSGGVGIVTRLTLVLDVQMDRGLVRVEIGLGAADVIALRARVAPHRDVFVLAVHVGLQVAFGRASVLTVLTLKRTL